VDSDLVVRLATRRALMLAQPVLEALPDGLVLADGMGRVDFVNRRLEELSGYDRSEILGYPIEVLVPKELRTSHEQLRAAFYRAPRNRPMGTGIETRLRRKDGTDLRVEIQLCPAEVEGEPTVIAAVRDVSERKEAELLVREREQLITRVAERESVGRSLQGEAIHTLFAVGLRLQSLALRTDDEETRAVIDETIVELDSSITELRRLVLDLRRDEL
jgi:PAS domain S-box-containing protein